MENTNKTDGKTSTEECQACLQMVQPFAKCEKHSSVGVTETQKKINSLFDKNNYYGELSKSSVTGNLYGSFRKHGYEIIRVIVDCERNRVEIGCSAEILEVEQAQRFSNVYQEALGIAKQVKSLLKEVSN